MSVGISSKSVSFFSEDVLWVQPIIHRIIPNIIYILSPITEVFVIYRCQIYIPEIDQLSAGIGINGYPSVPINLYVNVFLIKKWTFDLERFPTIPFVQYSQNILHQAVPFKSTVFEFRIVIIDGCIHFRNGIVFKIGVERNRRRVVCPVQFALYPK